MGNFNTQYNDRVRYTLQHSEYGNQIIPEPEGWNEDDKEFARNKIYLGIFAKFSNSLKFIKSGKEFINNVRSVYGVNASVRLIKEYKNQDDVWTRAYTGFLDLAEWGTQKGKVTVKFNSGGFEKLIKARKSDKLEIERLECIGGYILPELELKALQIDGRRIFLKTTFETSTANNESKNTVESNAGNTRNDTSAFPLDMTGQSHDLAASTLPEADGNEDNGSTGMMVYALNDRTRNLKLDFNYDFEAYFQQYENVQWCRYRLGMVIYENGVNYDVKQRIIFHELTSEGTPTNDEGVSYQVLPADQDYPYAKFSVQMTGSFTKEIELLQDESIAFELYLKSDMFVDNNAGVRCYARGCTGDLIIEEDSSYPTTTTNAVYTHDVLERLVSVITNGKDNFRSNYYGRKEKGYEEDGPSHEQMWAHGHWIRGFNKGADLYKPFAMSFIDAIKSCMAIDNVGLGIERIGFGEKVIVEDKKFFFNPNVTIRLGKVINGKFEYLQVQNVKRKTRKKAYHSSINIGAEKGGEYEEVMGLEETNTSANFTTVIDAVVNEYKYLSKVRVDTYGPEIERRRGILEQPTTDRPSDKDVFAFDAKKQFDGTFVLKQWQDVLDAEPIGMFSPETSFNFNYSPVNLLTKKHGWVLQAGLSDYPLDEIKYGDSRGKSKVTMQSAGQPAYEENGNIPNSDLEKNRFVPEDIEFEYKVDNDLLAVIEGYSIILGKKIPNIYGTVEFKNEFGELERGFLDVLKPNKKGKWNILKSSR